MEQIYEQPGLLTDQIEKVNVKVLEEPLFKKSKVNELKLATPVKNEIKMNENLIYFINFAKDRYKLIRTVATQLYALIKQDSFKYLRYSVSILLLVFSLVFFLLTLYQEKDIYENVFNFFYSNIEIKNTDSKALPN